uniref:Reverse transcriptase domain-containing protein n=1 Tax=Nicotiana tabacum TaxID=4097 RepID=A0A1S3Y982_TOBAC|nr:PREDICTED: uncharacterized protein LOC107773821 [Nicotiana tabacum]
MHASDRHVEDDDPDVVHYHRYGRIIIVPKGNGDEDEEEEENVGSAVAARTNKTTDVPQAAGSMVVYKAPTRTEDISEKIQTESPSSWKSKMLSTEANGWGIWAIREAQALGPLELDMPHDGDDAFHDLFTSVEDVAGTSDVSDRFHGVQQALNQAAAGHRETCSRSRTELHRYETDLQREKRNQKSPNLEDYVNESTSIPSEIKAMRGIDLVVDLNAEKEENHMKRGQSSQVPQQQIEVTSLNKVTVVIPEDQMQTEQGNEGEDDGFSPKKRKDLWCSLETIHAQIDGPWCIRGDFNVILDPDEKRGGRPHKMYKSLDFSSCMNNCEVMDLGFVGPKFTWCNNWEPKEESEKEQPSFMQLMEEVWKTRINGNSMWRLQQNLKLLSRRLSQWSKEYIGNIYEQVHMWGAKVHDLEELNLANNTDTSRAKLNKGQAKYIKWMIMQDALLRHKSRIKWFEEGESNTNYFHSTIKDRRRRLQLHRIKDHKNRWVEGDDNISKATIHYLQKLFNIKHQLNDYDILNFIPKCITTDDNAHLTAIPDIEKIKEVIFNMSSFSAAGPDSYNGTFFQKYWEIIKKDIHEFIQDCFNGKRMAKFFSHTCLVLIPKVDAPTNFSELRPISLSNFTSKIISKILARRLNPLLEKLISENQSGFVKGRMITENILPAQEIAQNINKNKRGGNMIIKLDMAKAYDRMSWNFLMSKGFFTSSQGLKQSDLLSPSLFIIGAEVLTRSLNSLTAQANFTPFTMDHRGPIINHLTYADDIVIFSGENNASIKLIKKQIRRYEKAYGKTTTLFDGMLSKIEKKLNGCKGRMISIGGRAIIIKHVIQSMPTYILSAMIPPKCTIRLMEKHFAKFFWGANEGKNNYHWSSWHNMCLPKDEGGIGIMRMEDVIKTTSIKRSKYYKRAHPVKKLSISSDSHMWKNLMKIKDKADPHIYWKIQAGNSSFWWDNWTGNGPLASLVQKTMKSAKVQVNNFIYNETWDINKLEQLLPINIINIITSLDIGNCHMDDFSVWNIFEDGHFSNKTAWNSCRYGNQKRFQLNHMKYQTIWTIKAVISKIMPGVDLQLQWPVLCGRMERLRPLQSWKQVLWKPFTRGTLKVNIDGSYSKKNGKAGIRGIVRDINGDLMMALSLPITCDSNNMTEAKAVEFGGKWCNRLRYTNFTLEINSMVIANMLSNRDTNNLKIKMVIDMTIDILQLATVTV